MDDEKSSMMVKGQNPFRNKLDDQELHAYRTQMNVFNDIEIEHQRNRSTLLP